MKKEFKPIKNIMRLASTIVLLCSSAAYAMPATDLDCSQCVDTGEIATNSITSGRIKNSEVKTDDIGSNAITSAKIKNLEVKNADIDSNAITTEKIKNFTIRTVDLAISSVTSGRIKNGEVKTVDIDDNAVTEAKLEQPLLDKINNAGSVGNNLGDMRYWDGTAWILITPPGYEASLRMCKGIPTWGACTYAIGDTGPAGGIVFKITDGGTHGLEAAPGFQGDPNTVTWGCWGTTTGATNLTDGFTNTTLIISGCSDPNIAARVADNFSLNGYNDWYLPAIGELEEFNIGFITLPGPFLILFPSPGVYTYSSTETSSIDFADINTPSSSNSSSTNNLKDLFGELTLPIRKF